jgi:hypothetical protein
MSTSPAPAAPPEASADASAPSSSPATSTDVVDVESLKAKAAEYDALKAKLDDQKRAEREERKRLQAEAEKAGEVSKAYEAAKARLAELEGLEPLAQKWRAYEAEEAKRLDTEAAAMPDAVRDLYATAGDIDAKRKVLAAFRAAAPGAPSKGTAPSMGAPPAVSGADFEAALADKSGKKAAELKARDPVGFAAWMRDKISGGKPAASSLGFGRFSSSPKAPNA